MPHPKLILLEGIPGAGKSSLAQCLARSLASRSIPYRWYYEEEIGHPVYCFHDLASLREILDRLSSGHYQQVIAAALSAWQEFARMVQSSETVVVLDGCLFGYLTWTLFPMDVPATEIEAYLLQVMGILQAVDPCIISLHHTDMAGALATICERRGAAWRAGFIAQANASAYEKRRGLHGFDGLVTYWQDYTAFMDAMLAQFAVPHLALRYSAGQYAINERLAFEFLEFPPLDVSELSVSDLDRCVGTYRCVEGDGEHIFDTLHGLKPSRFFLVGQRHSESRELKDVGFSLARATGTVSRPHRLSGRTTLPRRNG